METAQLDDRPPRLRVGTAPDSWGVWFADDPAQVPWSRFLDEVVAAGYTWIELGPYGYLPTDPHQLEDELGSRGLRLSAGTVFTALHRGEEQWREALVQARRIAGLVTSLGAEHLVVIPDLWRSDGTGEPLEPRTIDDEQWSSLAEGHDLLGRTLLEEFGVSQQFHTLADSHVGTTEEVLRLLDRTDPRYVNLCLDTGHFAYYGGDSVALMAERPDRIGYLHLKQVDDEVLREVRENDVPFASAVAAGVMCEPPGGTPDLLAVLDIAARIDPDMFAIVEQDMYGCSVDAPLPIARRTREHLS